MGLDFDKLKAKISGTASSNSKKNDKKGYFFNIDVDQNRVARMLPDVTGESVPIYEMKYHYPAIDGKNRKFLCLKQFGKKCPVCDLSFELWPTVANKNYQDPARKAVKTLFQTSRFYTNVYVRSELHDKEISEVLFWGFSKKLATEFIEKLGGTWEGIDITDVDDGHDLIISKKKGAYYDEVSFDIKPKSSVLAEDPEEIKQILDQRLTFADPRFEGVFDEPSEEKIQKMKDYLKTWLDNYGTKFLEETPESLSSVSAKGNLSDGFRDSDIPF